MKTYLRIATLFIIATMLASCGWSDVVGWVTGQPAAPQAAAPEVQPTSAPAVEQPVVAAPVEAPIGSAECNAFKENEQAPLSGQPRTGFDMTVGSPYHRQVVNVWLAPDKLEVSVVLPAMKTQHEAFAGVYGHIWHYPVNTGCDSSNLVFDAVRYAQEKGRGHHTGLVITFEEYLKYTSGKSHTALVTDAFAVNLTGYNPADPTK